MPFNKVKKLFPDASEGLEIETLYGSTALLYKLLPSFRFAENSGRVELRWSMQHAPLQIPTSSAPRRIMEKILSMCEMQEIKPESAKPSEPEYPVELNIAEDYPLIDVPYKGIQLSARKFELQDLEGEKISGHTSEKALMEKLGELLSEIDEPEEELLGEEDDGEIPVGADEDEEEEAGSSE